MKLTHPDPAIPDVDVPAGSAKVLIATGGWSPASDVPAQSPVAAPAPDHTPPQRQTAADPTPATPED